MIGCCAVFHCSLVFSADSDSPSDSTVLTDTNWVSDTMNDSPYSEDALFEEDTVIDNGDTAAAEETIADRDRDTLIDTADSTLPQTIGSAQTPVRPAWLFQGLSLEQDELAQNLLRSFCMFDWDGVERSGRKLQRLEKKKRLPPLSSLLLIGAGVFRIQNGEYESEREKKELLRDIEKLTDKGLELTDPDKAPDSLAAISLFLSGGIKGFVATLEIDRNPVSAALNGFSAVNLLHKAAELDSSMSDIYLGLGLFNCALAKASPLVRGALSIIGKEASLGKGLDYLRRSAYHGRYTNDIAKLYLIDFLSPYLGDQAKEKNMLFRQLQKTYPANPYFLFIELEENLCFHQKHMFSFSSTQRVRRQIARFGRHDRYANLVKWQYLLVNPFPSSGIAPDTTIDLRNFAFYPVFLRALREKILYERETDMSRRDRMRRLHFIREQGAKAAQMLDATDQMADNRKGIYQWHIRDALRMARGR
jgi:hypothetical protein